MMPPFGVFAALALLCGVLAWACRTWNCDDELSAGERAVLDALTRLWERRQ